MEEFPINLAEVLRLVSLLDNENIKYVIIGGVPAIFWGCQIVTLDLDIGLPLTIQRGNVGKVIKLLFDNGYKVIKPEKLTGKELDGVVEYVNGGGEFLKFLDGLIVDLLFKLDDMDIKQVYRNRHKYTLPNGQRINVIAFEDLLTIKRALVYKYHHTKDLAVLEQLEALNESISMPKPIPSHWIRRLRKINGEVHLVKIRKVNGKVETKVLM